MSNTLEVYMEILHTLTHSHRMLLRLAKLDPTKITMTERNAAYAQCEKVQKLLDKVTGDEDAT